MADSWKSIDLNKFVLNDNMIDYVLHKYGTNWQVHDVIADDILDDLLKREWEKQQHVKVSTDDTLKSSSDDTCSSDSTWEQKKASKGRPGLSSRNAAITKLEKPKSRSKHLAPTTPRTGSTCTTLLVPTKRPPLVTNCALGLAAIKTWQQILNKEFEIKKAKEDVGGSSYVRRKGKRKMM
ncbi:hypothetical protein Tco_0098157 [Tanacetum coccineum]